MSVTLPVSFTGRSGSNSAENEWWAAADPAASAAMAVRAARFTVMRLVLLVLRGAVLVAHVLQMLEVGVVFVARHLEQLVRFAVHRHLDRPRASVRDRIGDGGPIDHRVGVDRRERLDDRLHVTDDVADLVEPGLAVEVAALDDERVALPTTRRITLPQADVIRQRRARLER